MPPEKSTILLTVMLTKSAERAVALVEGDLILSAFTTKQ